jgi:hypothetical protein
MNTAMNDTTPQDDWDRLLVSTFWPDFTRTRPRHIWQIKLSFKALHGVDIPAERWPPPWYDHLHVSLFVCGRMKALARVLIAAEDHPEIDQIVRLMQRSHLEIWGGKTHQQRADAWDLKKTRQRWKISKISRDAFREFRNGETAPGGASKRGTRRKLARQP